MKSVKKLLVSMCLLALIAAVGGCGNVSLRGASATAAETSALHAHQAAKRAAADPDMPEWGKVYTAENFKQWRFFVRSNRADENLGPKLDGE